MHTQTHTRFFTFHRTANKYYSFDHDSFYSSLCFKDGKTVGNDNNRAITMIFSSCWIVSMDFVAFSQNFGHVTSLCMTKQNSVCPLPWWVLCVSSLIGPPGKKMSASSLPLVSVVFLFPCREPWGKIPRHWAGNPGYHVLTHVQSNLAAIFEGFSFICKKIFFC